MSLDTLINRGIALINIPDTSPDTKTVIVVGAARGGTSIIAGTLHHLGIFLGRNCHPPVYEDMRLSIAFEGGSKETFEEVISDYNHQYQIWAWKRPSVIHELPRVMAAVRNPYVIFVFRDLFSIANRNSISMKMGIKDGLQRALDDYIKIIGFIQNCHFPTMFVSSEKAIRHKTSLVEELCSFLDFNPAQEYRHKALDFISPDPEHYLDATRITRTKGGINIDFLRTGILRGWARAAYHTNPVQVEVLVDKNLIATVPANVYRQQFKRPGIHPTGVCGYELDLKPYNVQPFNHITIRVKDDVVALNKEPISFPNLKRWMTIDEWWADKRLQQNKQP